MSAIPLTVPALRARREDIPLLARRFLEACGADLGRAGLELSPDAERALQSYGWPGNIRELRNVLERAALLSGARVLDRRHLVFESEGAAAGGVDTSLTLEEVERRHVERVLEEEGGHVGRAAVRLGVPRSSLYQRVKKLGLGAHRLIGSR